MSHFAIMIIGENPEKQLAPYQENNNGDCPKEYLKWNSVADDYESIDEAVEDGYKLKDGIPGYMENPNAKWDWYQLGGRWTGYFKLKNGSNGNVGNPGLMTGSAKSGYTDQCIKKAIDIQSMIDDAKNKAENEYDLAHSIIDGQMYESWEFVRTRIHDIDKARKEYHNQPLIKKWNKSDIKKQLGFLVSPDDFKMSKDKYLKNACDSVITTFAVIKNGKWYERGEMGWWGLVSNEKDSNEWNEQISKLFKELSDDTLISIYDCHI